MPARAGSRLLGGADLVDIAGLMAAGHPALQAVQQAHRLLQTAAVQHVMAGATEHQPEVATRQA